MRQYKKWVIVLILSQALFIIVVIIWYGYQEFVLANFDAFITAQLVMSIANPVVRFLVVLTGIRTWLWALAGLPLGGQVGGAAFALQGLFYMILLDVILGPLTTFAMLLKVVPNLFPRLGKLMSPAKYESGGSGGSRRTEDDDRGAAGG